MNDKLSELIKKVGEKMYEDVVSSLIDKSIPKEEIGKKTILQIDFAQRYGFFMPLYSLIKFNDIENRLYRREEYIIKPLMLFTRIRYLFYINYITRKQKSIRKQVAQNR
jgi:hypothetical protein